MALSGVINGSTSNENISSRIVWEGSQSTAGNYTLLTVTGRLSRTNYGYVTGGDGTFYLEIDGKQYSASGYYEISQGSDTIVIKASAVKIPHESNGKKKLKISFTGSIPGTTLSSISCGGTIELTDIPRASSFTIPDSAIAGEAFKVDISRAVNTFKHDITLSLGTRNETYKDIDTEIQITVPIDWIDQIPSAESGALTVSVATKSNGEKIGSKSNTMMIIVPDDIVPTVSIGGIEPVDAYWGLYIQSKSKVTISLLAEGTYGSTIQRYSIAGGGYTGTTNPYTSGILMTPGAIKILCTVYDSRGRSADIETEINVVPYEKPHFIDLAAYRSNADGAANRSGTYITVKATGSHSDCGGNNTRSMTARYKKVGSESYSQSETIEDSIAKIIGAGCIETTSEYVIEIAVADYFEAIKEEILIGQDKFGIVIGKNRDVMGLLMHHPDGGKGIYMPDLHTVGIIYPEKGINAQLSYASSDEDETGLNEWLSEQYSNLDDGIMIPARISCAAQSWGSSATFYGFLVRNSATYGYFCGTNYAGTVVRKSLNGGEWKEAQKLTVAGVVPVSAGGLGASSFASALGLTLIANKSNAVRGACSAGTSETIDVSGNILYLVIAWSHVAVGTRTAMAICSNYSNTYVDKILSGGYAPTISMSGSKITISRESYRYNYCIWRIGI